MSRFEDNEFDLCLTDPPYGILENAKLGSGNTSKKAGGHATNYGDIIWDGTPMSEECFNEIQRISKNQIIFGGNFFPYLPYSRGWMVWDKRKNVVPQRSYADGELIWTSYDTPLRICYHLWDG
ncbi:MAG: DNA methyltransferase, partial [Candidatus Thorarchaeota archaeon]